MPIKDWTKYPATWKQLSAALGRVRTALYGDVCEECGAPNHAWIARSERDGSRYLIFNFETGGYETPSGEQIRLSEVPDEYLYTDPIKIVLTVHHAGVPYADGRPGDPDDKSDNRLANLFRLCQRCHFKADAKGNAAKRRHTRLAAERAAVLTGGQMEWIGDETEL